MDNQGKTLKQYNPIQCPHCKEEILIAVESIIPMISATTKLDIDNAKNAIKARLDEIVFSDKKEKKEIIEWLDNPETLLGFEDIESLILQISKDQCEKIQQHDLEQAI